MRLKLHIWRQKSGAAEGAFVSYEVPNVSPDMSFLEMLDVLNEHLLTSGGDPVAFDHDCREGICGMCGMVINGEPHGPRKATTVCQLHMRSFNDGDELWLEPWRAQGFPVIRDLAVDRSALDRMVQAGGYISVRTGSAPEANSTLIPKPDSDGAFDAATCIGCGACVAACPNASGMLFLSAKVSHLAQLPQGQPERFSRVRKMVAQHDAEGFGACTNHRECEASCPKEISILHIARLNRDLLKAQLAAKEEKAASEGAG
jgi:succinate dehydrogenase / fumarate reductase, iron-sulfur subunit